MLRVSSIWIEYITVSKVIISRKIEFCILPSTPFLVFDHSLRKCIVLWNKGLWKKKPLTGTNHSFLILLWVKKLYSRLFQRQCARLLLKKIQNEPVTLDPFRFVLVISIFRGHVDLANFKLRNMTKLDGPRWLRRIWLIIKSHAIWTNGPSDLTLFSEFSMGSRECSKTSFREKVDALLKFHFNQ